MSSYNLHNAELLIARFNDARATALEVAGQLPAAHDEIRALRASLRAMRADLEQSVSRHKMCQENLASACAERDQLRAERDALAMRRDELLVTVRNLSLQTPYPEEERNAAVLIAEVGALKARVAEVERERDAAVRERDEADRLVARWEKLGERHDLMLREPGCQCQYEIGDSPCPIVEHCSYCVDVREGLASHCAEHPERTP